MGEKEVDLSNSASTSRNTLYNLSFKVHSLVASRKSQVSHPVVQSL